MPLIDVWHQWMSLPLAYPHVHRYVGSLMARALPVWFIVISPVPGKAWHVIGTQQKFTEQLGEQSELFLGFASIQSSHGSSEGRLLWRLWIRGEGSAPLFLFSFLQIPIPTGCLPLLLRLLLYADRWVPPREEIPPLWIRALSHTVFGRRTHFGIRTAASYAGTVQVHKSWFKKLPSLDELPCK